MTSVLSLLSMSSVLELALACQTIRTIAAGAPPMRYHPRQPVIIFQAKPDAKYGEQVGCAGGPIGRRSMGLADELGEEPADFIVLRLHYRPFSASVRDY